MVCDKHIKTSCEQHQPIKELIWISIYNYIKVLYDKSAFEQAEPTTVNRHWVLHGRTETAWQRIDCVRLLAALYTIAVIAKNDR